MPEMQVPRRRRSQPPAILRFVAPGSGFHKKSIPDVPFDAATKTLRRGVTISSYPTRPYTIQRHINANRFARSLLSRERERVRVRASVPSNFAFGLGEGRCTRIRAP
jgi:16S rRNA U516 pseudouridylate synthase RsuA-like enzyme